MSWCIGRPTTWSTTALCMPFDLGMPIKLKLDTMQRRGHPPALLPKA